MAARLFHDGVDRLVGADHLGQDVHEQHGRHVGLAGGALLLPGGDVEGDVGGLRQGAVRDVGHGHQGDAALLPEFRRHLHGFDAQTRLADGDDGGAGAQGVHAVVEELGGVDVRAVHSAASEDAGQAGDGVGGASHPRERHSAAFQGGADPGQGACLRCQGLGRMEKGVGRFAYLPQEDVAFCGVAGIVA